MPELDLDVCTPEGKTWLAQVLGTDRAAPGGLQREFLTAVSSRLSRSGMTGTKTYLVTDGAYESNEGRKRYGRRWWVVTGDQVREVDRAEALAHVTG